MKIVSFSTSGQVAFSRIDTTGEYWGVFENTGRLFPVSILDKAITYGKRAFL